MLLKELWRLQEYEKFRANLGKNLERERSTHIGSGVWKGGRSITGSDESLGRKSSDYRCHGHVFLTSRLQCSKLDLNLGGNTEVGNLVESFQWEISAPQNR